MSHRLWTMKVLAVAVVLSAPAEGPAEAKDLIIIEGPIKAEDVVCSSCIHPSDIRKNAVTGSKIRNNAVTSRKIQDGAVGAADIRDGAVGAAEIGNNAVGAAEIQAGAVTNAKIGARAVGTTNIQDKSITLQKLADGVLPSGGVAPDSVGTTELQDGAVTTPKLADRAVGTAKIENAAVTSGKLATGAVTTGKIADNAVSLSKLGQDVRDSIPSFQAVAVLVDCAAGDSVQDALDALQPGQPATITIVGTCFEAVSIIRDDVTLQGDGALSGGVPTSGIDAGQVNNPISVDGARRIKIDGLVLRNGSGSGLSAFDGATLTVTNNVMENNGGNGMFLGLNATAQIDNNQIRNNTLHGIRVMFDASARITNNMITDNDGNGIQVTDKSSAWIGLDFGGMGGNTIARNLGAGIMQFNGSSTVIQGNIIDGNNIEIGEAGVSLYRSTAALIGDNRITSNNFGIIVSQSSLSLNLEGFKDDLIADNRQDGIIAFDGSSLDIREGLIESNGTTGVGDFNGISVNDNSTMRIRRATIQNNVGSGIVLRRGGGVVFRAPDATVRGHFDQAGEFDLECRGSQGAPAGETHYAGGFTTGGTLGGIATIASECVLVHGF